MSELADLSGSRVVVLGGTGGIGSHFVRTYAQAGAHVVVLSRSEQAAQRLLSDPWIAQAGRVDVMVADYASFEAARASAAELVERFGPVDHVVSTLGSWFSGPPLWQVTEEEFTASTLDVVSVYVATAAAWIPLLPAAGSLHWIVGASGVIPVPGASLMSTAQAALVMGAKVLALEAPAGPSVHALILGNLNQRRRPYRVPDFVNVEDVTDLSVFLSASEAPSTEFVLRHPAAVRSARQKLGLTPAAATA